MMRRKRPSSEPKEAIQCGPFHGYYGPSSWLKGGENLDVAAFLNKPLGSYLALFGLIEVI